MKAKTVVPLALVFVLLAAVPIYAAAPVGGTVHFEETWALDPQPCPGMEVLDHEIYTVRWTSYPDNQGNPVRTRYHVEGTDNFYNAANPDFVLSGDFIVNAVFNEVTQEFYESAIPIHITVPGYGTVLVTAGRWFPDGRMVGKNSFLDPKDLGQFCGLLAGD